MHGFGCFQWIFIDLFFISNIRKLDKELDKNSCHKQIVTVADLR